MSYTAIAKITSDESITMGDISTLQPNGDRYLVKPVNVVHRTSSDLVLPIDETTTGWFAARILAVGNGHRLEVPDPAVVTYRVSPSEDTLESTVERPQATVPMFFSKGDVVLIDRLAGRPVTVQGVEYRIVNQVDVLAKIGTA